MIRATLAVLALTGCGRVAFDARDDAGAGNVDDALMSDGLAGSSLLLHFTFDTSPIVEARGRDASCQSCPTIGAGRVGAGAAVFTGAQCLEIADGPDLRPTTFTLATWLNVSLGAGSFTSYVGKAKDGATTTNNSFELYLQADSSRWNFIVDEINAGTGHLLDAWHHLAGRFDGVTVALYLDGALVQEVDGSAVTYTSDPVRIGCDLNIGALDAFTIGQLDDVRLYDRALSAAEIAALAAM